MPQSRLIEDLLDTSRISLGKVSLNLAPADVASVIQSAVETVMPLALSKGVQIDSRYESDAPPAQADFERLRQVFWNLLTNAVKFTPEGGTIRVVLRRVDGEVEVRVIDTGIGIDAQCLPHIFDRFRQFTPPNRPDYGGLGLGLTISQQIIELHGGTITAESAGSGKGSTFVIRLPASDAPLAASAPGQNESDENVALANRRILLVEDNEFISRATAILLRRAGAKVTEVHTAETALSQWMQIKPDLIISDISLPEVDGYELIRRIRASERETGAPPTLAVALTAYAGDEDRHRALEAGFNEHLSKPIDTKRLLSRLAALSPEN